MKHFYLSCTLLVLLSPASVANVVTEVSIDFADGSLPELIRTLANLQQLNLHLDPAITSKISIHLQRKRWHDVWSRIAKQSNLSITCNEKRIEVRRAKIEVANTSLNNKSTFVSIALHPQYRNVKVLAEMIKAELSTLLHTQGAMLVDEETNRLILYAEPSQLATIEKWFYLLDKPIQQIEITAHIVTISEDHLKELGVNWHSYDAGNIEAMLGTPMLDIPLSVPGAAVNARVTLAKLGGKLLDLELSALEIENKIDIIASPRLVTSNHKMASIKQGTEIPYSTSSGKRDEYPIIEFKEAVLGMQITPDVMGNEMIRLRIHLSQNVPGKPLHESDNSPVSIDKQEIDTEVMIKNGQTLALGGIFQQQNQSERRQVPGFGSLPWIGALFRRDTRQERRRELVIFITPKLQSSES
jgi:protein transport protein HofQ